MVSDVQIILKDIDPVHLSTIQLASSSSVYLHNDLYQIISLRLLQIGPEELEDSTLHFIIYKDDCYSIDRSLNIEFLKNGFEDIYQIINNRFLFTQNIMMNYEDSIDDMEDQLFDRKISRNFIEDWFRMKKDFAKIQRILTRAHLVLDEFAMGNFLALGELSVEFKDLSVKFSSIERSAQAKLTKLDHMFHFYNSIKSERLNRSIYILSLISGLFLPLNLIVGFFGMNTENLFFASQDNGTERVIMLMISVFCFLVLFIPTITFLDKILLSKVFGKTKYYEELIKKMKAEI